MTKVNVVSTLIVAIFMSGCTTTQTLSESGRQIELKKNTGIVIGKTTKRQIFDLYGQPANSQIMGKYEVLAYSYSRDTYESEGAGSFALGLIPVVGEAKFVSDLSRDRGKDNQTNKEWQDLEVYLDLSSGIVRDYSYHDSKLNGHDESESLLLKSMAAFGENRNDEGMKLLEQAVAANPGNHRAANTLAWRLIDLSIDVDKGIALAKKAVEVFPDSPHNNGTLGVGYLKKGDLVNAELYLQKAIDLFPVYAPQDFKSLQHDKAMLATIRSQKKS
jgi:tetratricopeptide (TPR) repeat protein